MREVTQIVLVYSDGSSVTTPVEQYEEPPELMITTEVKRKKRRAKPRRRCQLCDELVPVVRWDEHNAQHEEISGVPAEVELKLKEDHPPDPTFDGDISVFDKEEQE
jgi:hypothetical protein